jgi:hypothetical protein
MKNTIKILGIIALVAIIGFSMLACDIEPDEENVSIPGPVEGYKATGASPFSISVEWDTFPGRNPTWVNVYRSDTVDGTYVIIGTSNGHAGVYTDSNIAPLTTRFYKLEAENGAGAVRRKGDQTPHFSGTTLALSAPNITIGTLTSGIITDRWAFRYYTAQNLTAGNYTVEWNDRTNTNAVTGTPDFLRWATVDTGLIKVADYTSVQVQHGAGNSFTFTIGAADVGNYILTVRKTCITPVVVGHAQDFQIRIRRD